MNMVDGVDTRLTLRFLADDAYEWFSFFHKTCSMDSGLQIDMPAVTAWPQTTLLLVSISRRM
jgi:hypothetical protein